MAGKKGISKFIEVRYFGFIIGLIIFALFFWLSFGLSIIDNIEQTFLMDTFFKWKLPFLSEKIQEGVTYKAQNPFISPDILIIGIDNKSLHEYGKWPFPRSIHANMVNSFTRIKNQGQRERALFLDLSVIEADELAPENDVLFIESIKENGRVFIDTFLQEGEITGSLGMEFLSRQKTLIENYGTITNIKGDTTKITINRSVEAPLKPYSRAVRGYGNASYIPDVDDIFRRQPLISRLAVTIEEIKLSELRPDYTIDQANFERLAWYDKDGKGNDVEYPLTESILNTLRRDMEKRAPAISTSGQEGEDVDFIVRKYKDHFIPSITLSLALEYFHKELSDIEIIIGKHIVIPKPQHFNVKTEQWEPHRILVTPAKYEIISDDLEQEKTVIKKKAVYRVLDELTIPIDESGAILINYMGLRSHADSSLNQTYPIRGYTGYSKKDPGPDPREWRSTMAAANKIVMVGIFAAGLAEDERPTPFGLMYGVEINANALNTILMNRFLIYAPWWVNALILLAIIMLISFLTSRVSTIWSLIISILSIFIFFFVVIYVFDFASYILTFSAPALGILLTFLTIVVYRVINEERDKRRIKNVFGKYVNPAVVDQILANPPELGGVDKEVTIFFSDIRGFTTFSENMTPQALVNHLNIYLTAMTDIILKHLGTLDKYEGDAIMCFWGAPVPQEDHAIRACKCAVDQIKALEILNKEWSSEKKINIGIGINSGIMTVGNMGSPGRMDYTVMGDNVNLGSRLESTNKTYLTKIIMSEYTYGLVKDKVIARELDNIRVKGKNKPVLIYELIDIVDGNSPAK
jgi:adenylate cyclase